ncbi:AEC family transporter [Falsiroseomonas oryzae]|uniref:AEC family transporter n=1 Tax=Falsiroseomonas oryzae TaxID=2766473 RepID=UPI0022EB960F|nr:AEC family transporter [Roseomonas sp. MO-31]
MADVLLVILVPIVAAMALGYAWVRSGRPFDNATLAPLAADLALPCLIFSTLASTQMPIEALAEMAGAALVALLAFAAVGAVLLRGAGLSLRTYLPSVTWGNSGYLGVPLGFYAFGASGLAYAAAFSAVSLMFNSVFAGAVAAGQASLRAVLRNPLVWAVSAGAAVRIAGIEVPRAILEPVKLVGGLAIPLTLMMVGASLARLKVGALRLPLTFSVLRTGIGVALALAVAALFGMEGTGRFVLVLQCAMPVGMLSYVLAQRFGNEPETIAGIIVVSTWMSVVSIPAMLSVMVVG